MYVIRYRPERRRKGGKRAKMLAADGEMEYEEESETYEGEIGSPMDGADCDYGNVYRDEE